jgi:hypothetical protein
MSDLLAHSDIKLVSTERPPRPKNPKLDLTPQKNAFLFDGILFQYLSPVTLSSPRIKQQRIQNHPRYRYLLYL